MSDEKLASATVSTASTPQLLRLIDRYIRAVTVMVEFPLQRGLGAGHPLRAWQEERIPKRGRFPKPFNGTYRFRDHGCIVNCYNRRVEFDFGPHGRTDGFTAYYLQRFVQLNKLVKREFGDLDIYAGIKVFGESNLVFEPKWEPTPHLLYLTSEATELLSPT